MKTKLPLLTVVAFGVLLASLTNGCVSYTKKGSDQIVWTDKNGGEHTRERNWDMTTDAGESVHHILGSLFGGFDWNAEGQYGQYPTQQINQQPPVIVINNIPATAAPANPAPTQPATPTSPATPQGDSAPPSGDSDQVVPYGSPDDCTNSPQTYNNAAPAQNNAVVYETPATTTYVQAYTPPPAVTYVQPAANYGYYANYGGGLVFVIGGSRSSIGYGRSPSYWVQPRQPSYSYYRPGPVASYWGNRGYGGWNGGGGWGGQSSGGYHGHH